MFRSRWILAGIATLATACAGGGGEPAPSFEVNGLNVVVATDAPFATRKDLPARVESTVEAALAYWGGSWRDLAGVTLTMVGAPTVACGESASLGCYDGNLRITTRDPGIGTFSCVEATVLVHEIGHAVIGDPNHEDPRWMDMAWVADALSNRVGYSEAGEVPCRIYPSVWRHLPGKP